MQKIRRFTTFAISLVFILGSLATLTFVSNVPVARARVRMANSNLTQYVNPFLGTGISSVSTGTPAGCGLLGEESPAENTPFGMISWGPDTSVNTCRGFWQYQYYDNNCSSCNQLDGFSLLHENGGNNRYIPFEPYAGAVSASPGSNPDNYRTTFSHSNESASPGYYQVKTDSNINVQLTGTTRAGYGTFTYPSGQTATMIVNLGDSLESTSPVTVNALTIDPSHQVISGYAGGSSITSGRYKIYFYAVFDHAFTSYSTFDGSTITSNGTSVGPDNLVGGSVTFDTSSNATVAVKVGMSMVSVSNAQANLTAEVITPNLDFNAVRSNASTAWNTIFNRVAVSGGSSNELTLFYTALYHSLNMPQTYSDDNGQYYGWDGNVHSAASGHTEYSMISSWDMAHVQIGFLSLLFPNETADIMQSMVDSANQTGGWMSRTIMGSNVHEEFNTGDFSVPATAYAMGVTNFDANGALHALMQNATQVSGNPVRGGNLSNYLNKGYAPSTPNTNSNGAEDTMEYATADFATAQLAKALGNTTDYTTLIATSDNWRNTFDQSLVGTNGATGYAWYRDSNGNYAGNFNPAAGGCYDAFQEASSAQDSFHVPQNFAGLFNEMGGTNAVIQRLDNLFTKLDDGCASPYTYMGNEPDFELPWIYDWAGAPWRTQNVVRNILTQLWSNSPTGLPGNEDWSAMSPWYVMGAIGLYPEVPGVGGFAVTSPLFTSITLTLESGKTIQINGNNGSDTNQYVQSLNLNGSSYDSPWLPLTSIVNGNSTNTLDFTLGNSQSTWGSSPTQNPPPSSSATGTLSGGGDFATGFESSDPQPTWTSTAEGSGSISNVVGICCNLPGPEMTVSNGSPGGPYSGSNVLLYSGQATNASGSDFAYMKVYDFSGQNFVISPTGVLSYWIFPESSSQSSGYATGNNSTCVAVDMIFTDGTDLRDSGAVDQNGNRAHPMYQCNHLTLDTWNHVIVNLGSYLGGKTLSRLNVGYDQPNTTGLYRGYIDDLSITGSWQTQDIGSVGLSGSAFSTNGTISATGSGADIWNNADAFRYVYQPLTGNGTIVAQVVSLQNTDPWAKAGVMMRETLDPASTQAFMLLSYANGSALQRRTTTGGLTTDTSGPNVAATYWVKLVRSGNTFTGYVSDNGSTWTLVGSDTISMANQIYVGLAVTAHTTSALNTSTFSNITVTIS